MKTRARSRFLPARLKALALGLGAALLASELALRFLPVATGMQVQPVHAAQPLFHFRANTDFVYSKGPQLALARTGHVNNYGFVNDQDYDPNAPGPLLAVIGDSYIEAAMVDYAETVQGRLAASVPAGVRVYSFAASGAPLSQYLAYAEFVRDEFDPAALVINFAGNDFDESVVPAEMRPGFHHFHEQPDGALALELKPYAPGPLRRLLRRSALLRYLVLNADVRGWFRGEVDADAEYFANTSAALDPERLRLSRAAVRAFLAELPARSGVDRGRILFTVDGPRRPVYEPALAPAAATSYVGVMRRYLIDAAREAGHEVVDLAPTFAAHYAAHGQRFEFPIDAHWNALAHSIVAAAVQRSQVYGRLVEPLD